MNAQKHQELLQEYIAKGGDLKHSKSFKQFSLQNFAKLKYELKKLGDPTPKEEIKPPPPTPEKAKTYRPKPFDDLILEYPPALHSIFKKRWEVWLEACSLKIQLGNIPEKEPQKAFDIQWKIYQCFQELDQCQTILNHYREHKRIMPTKTQKDLSIMSEMELFKHRNNLRTLITRRKQTINLLEKNLPEKEHQDYTKKLHHLNLKKEQLQQKINELLECDKLLNHGK